MFVLRLYLRSNTDSIILVTFKMIDLKVEKSKGFNAATKALTTRHQGLEEAFIFLHIWFLLEYRFNEIYQELCNVQDAHDNHYGTMLCFRYINVLPSTLSRGHPFISHRGTHYAVMWIESWWPPVLSQWYSNKVNHKIMVWRQQVHDRIEGHHYRTLTKRWFWKQLIMMWNK